MRDTPSTTTMVLQHQQLWPGFHIEKLGHFEKQRQQLGHRNGFGGLAVDRLANGADSLRETRHIMRVRHIARLEMHFGDAHIVARNEAIENFGQKTPLLLVETSGNAKIDRDDQPLRIDKQIARMHIRMEKPSRSVCRRKDWISVSASFLRSKPAASSAEISDILMPSIHSSVSTSRPVRSQSTFGTRKPLSSLIFSAISDSAAASSRRSISIRVVCWSVSTT